MTRRLLCVLVAVLSVGGVAVADVDTVAHVTVLPSEGPWQVAERLCPHAPEPVFADLFAANPWLRVVPTVYPGTELHWHPASCPAPTTTTTEASTSTTTTTEPATSTTTTTTVPTPTTTEPPASSGFTATFDTPADFFDRFLLDVHFRSPETAEYGETFSGDHDMGCHGPDTQRPVNADPAVDGAAGGDLAESELFWWCAPNGAATGHVMTGMGDIDGYTILSFAPDQTFTDVTRVCWDVNATDLGGRKWTQAIVLPAAAFTANGGRLDYISPVTQGVDTTALPLPDGAFMFQMWDHKIRLFDGGDELAFDWFRWTTADRATRYTNCIVDNGDGTITVTREIGISTPDAPSGVRSVTVDGSLPDQAVVIFQDDNYTPLKDGPIAGFTWHWDNIFVDVG